MDFYVCAILIWKGKKENGTAESECSIEEMDQC